MRQAICIGVFVSFYFITILSSSLFGQNNQPPVRIGVVSMITPVDTVKYYQEIIDYISARMDVPVEMVYRKTYDEMDRMLEKGDVDAAFICSAPYVEDKRKFGAELLVAPQVDGNVFYKSFIIVHKDSTFRSFDELKGKTFAFTDPKSNSGRLYPVYRLAKEGYKPEDYFSKYIYSYSHNKSVELVAKKIVDGAAIENLIYHYMKNKGSPYTEQVRIIEQSPDFGIPPMVNTPGMSTFVKEKIREILINMHRNPDGARILSDMQVEKFVEGSDSYYDSVREMESFVTLFHTPEVTGANEKKTVYFGVIPKDNPRIAYEKYQLMIDYLSDNTPYKVELVLKKTYDDTVRALGHGEIDIAFLGPLTYLHARSEYKAVSILKSITERGSPSYRSVIVTKSNNSINDLSDLERKDFAFASMKSTSGNLIPRFLLAENGIHLRELKSYNNFNYHDSVIKWVLKGMYDAGAVRESIAEKYLPLGLKIISKSGPIPTGPVVVGPRTPYAIVESIKSTLLNLNKSEEGKEILEKTDPEMRGGFIEASDLDYEHIRQMLNDIPNSCGMGCHPKIKL
jgi:phosphonate transport system substrate-binding protein